MFYKFIQNLLTSFRSATIKQGRVKDFAPVVKENGAHQDVNQEVCKLSMGLKF